MTLTRTGVRLKSQLSGSRGARRTHTAFTAIDLSTQPESATSAHDMAPQPPPALPLLDDEEAGVMGLTEVEPSPVEETPNEFKEGYFPVDEKSEGQQEFGLPRRTTTTLGLGGSHGPVWWCTSRTPSIYI